MSDMPTAVQRLFVVVLSFLVGCACTYVMMVPSSRDKSISGSPPTSIADAAPTGAVAAPPVPLSDTSTPPPPPAPFVPRPTGDPFREREREKA